jgi:hypothetical protein
MELDWAERDLCNGRKVGEADSSTRQSCPDLSEAITKDQNNSIKMGGNMCSEL